MAEYIPFRSHLNLLLHLLDWGSVFPFYLQPEGLNIYYLSPPPLKKEKLLVFIGIKGNSKYVTESL